MRNLIRHRLVHPVRTLRHGSAYSQGLVNATQGRPGRNTGTQSATTSPYLCRVQGGSTPLMAPSRQVPLLQHRPISFFGLGGKEPWKQALSDAERIVGYPTSFMSLRYLLSDELASVAMHLRKLVGTKHPLLQTAKSFLYDGSHSLQTRGLIVLLVAKAAGPSTAMAKSDLSPAETTGQPLTEPNQPLVGGIHPSQRILAEITEMIYTAFLVHRGVMDLSVLRPADGPPKDIEYGNKIAVLSGDFLLASASSALARLKNTLVVDLISQSIDHMTQGAFAEMGQGDPAPGPAFGNLEEWKDYVYLSSGSLIAHSCKAVMLLTNHTQEFVNAAFEFGRNIAWAQQLHQDLLLLESGQEDLTNSSFLQSSLLALHNETSPYREQTPSELWEAVRKGSYTSRVRALCQEHADAAMDSIRDFPNEEAKKALKNLLQAWTFVK